MTIFDLKSGYHHLELAASQHELVGFSYTDWKGRERCFHFIALPFGLSTAGLIFTKVLRVMINYWRSQRIQALAFLDDGLQTNSSYDLTRKHALIIKGSLLAAGWIPHREKSIWIPVRIIKWLGFVVDLVQGRLFCTTDRITHAEQLIKLILSKD